MKGSMRQRSPGSWELKFDLPPDGSGKRRVRTCTFKGNKKEAEIELRRVLAEVDKGVEVDNKLTLGTYLEIWLEGHRPTISPSTAEFYERLIRVHIIPEIGGLKLARLTHEQLSAFYGRKAVSGRRNGKGGLSAQTIRHIDRGLHAALAEAVPGLLSHNPVDKAKAPQVERKKHRPLSDDEFSALEDAAEGTRLEVPVVTLLGTGLRRGELLALSWRNVDLTAKVLRVVATVEKTQRGSARIKEPKTAAGWRRVDLPDTVVSALAAHRRKQQEEWLAFGRPWNVDVLVFADPITGGIRSPGAFSAQFIRLAKRAGVKITVKGLRHEHFSRLLAAGEHPKVAQLRAGHSSIAVTMDLYSHATEALQQGAASRFENVFATIRKHRGGNSGGKTESEPKGKVIKL